jgi:hypothetical protein
MTGLDRTTKKNNKELPAFLKQLIELLPTLLLSGILALSGSLFTIWLANYTENPVWKLAKDAADVIGYPPYYGMLSSWSSMLWMATSTVCLFTAAITWNSTSDRAMWRFVLFSGLLSFMLAVDDLYLLHDRILPRALHTSEDVFYLLYLFLMTGYIIIFIRQIIRSDYILFWIAFFFLAFSRGFYKLIPLLGDFYTANDMFKYFGIVFWLAFFVRTAAKQLQR